MDNKLFVGGIAWGTTEADLMAHFEQVGAVASVKIIMDRETGRSRGFGFVEMETEELAEATIEQLDNQELQGRSLRVNLARPQEGR